MRKNAVVGFEREGFHVHIRMKKDVVHLQRTRTSTYRRCSRSFSELDHLHPFTRCNQPFARTSLGPSSPCCGLWNEPYITHHVLYDE